MIGCKLQGQLQLETVFAVQWLSINNTPSAFKNGLIGLYSVHMKIIYDVWLTYSQCNNHNNNNNITPESQSPEWYCIGDGHK